MDDTSNLAPATYVSLKTFRRSGAGVATPVWSAFADGCYYIFSAGDAGKVKRLRHSPEAELALCSFNGTLLGPWHKAEATLITEPQEIAKALSALRKKYGWQMRLADVGATLTGKFHRRAYISVTLKPSS